MAVPVSRALKECHRLRRLLRDLQSEIDLGPRLSRDQLATRAEAEQAHAAAHAAVAALKLKIREDEVTLKQMAVQLAKFEKQLETAGKEYDAKQTEIRHAKERIAATEEGVLASMEELDARTAALPDADAVWVEAQRQYDEDQAEGKERLDRLAAEHARASAELADVETLLPADAKAHYDRLVKRHGADALAAGTGKVCGHCRTTLTEQQKYDMQAGKFICCPNCGRALYAVE